MRINYRTPEVRPASARVRYDVAWFLGQPQFHAPAQKPCWWLDSSFASEAAATLRLKELQEPLSRQGGSVALYELQHDEANHIVSERVVTYSGKERPPLRTGVRVPGNQLKVAFGHMVRSLPVKGPRKSKSGIAQTLAVAAGFSCMIGLAVFFAGTQIRNALDRSTAHQLAEAERQRTEPGKILVPRAGLMCDRILFDNQAGNMTSEGAVPCYSEPSDAARPTWPGSRK